MLWNSAKGNLSSRSLLDRVVSNSQNGALSEAQLGVDQLVGSALKTVADEKMMVSLFAAGTAGKFIRLGSLLNSSSALESLGLRAFSQVTALAGESAVFAGVERKLADHASTQSFQKDWARAFLNLGSLKLLGGAAAGQNFIVQHLFADLGMVAGHEAGYALGVTDAPQGSLTQRMIQAEGMNLGMKGSLALLHGFAPGLSAMERSVDLTLKSQETGLFSQGQLLQFFPQLAVATEGGPGSFLANSKKQQEIKGPSILHMSKNDGGGSGKDSQPSWLGTVRGRFSFGGEKTGEKTREVYLEELEELATKERWAAKDLYELIRGGNNFAMKALIVMVAHEEHRGTQLTSDGLGLEEGPWWALNALGILSRGGAQAINSLKRLTFTDHEPVINVLIELARTNEDAGQILIELAKAGSENARRALSSL